MDQEPADTTVLQEDGVDRDAVFDILSSSRRRYVLRYLCDRQTGVHLKLLARHIAAEEVEKSPEEVVSEDERRVYTSLYQTHIPKLAESGLVSYDSDSGEVALANASTEIDPYLMDGEQERPWYRYYLILAAINLGLVGAVVAGVPVVSTLGGAGVGVVVVGSFLVLTAVHYFFGGPRRSASPPGFDEP